MTKKDFYLGAITGVITGFFVQYFIVDFQFLAGPSGISGALSLGIIVGTTIIIPIGLFISSLLAKLYSVFWRFGKFVAVGLMNTAADFGILFFLASYSAVFSGFLVGGYNVIAVGIAMINSYFWNKYWVFEQSKTKNRYEFIQFVSVTISGLLINSGIVYYITTFVTSAGGLTPDKWLLVAKIIATTFTLFWNFIGYKIFVFRAKEEAMSLPR